MEEKGSDYKKAFLASFHRIKLRDLSWGPGEPVKLELNWFTNHRFLKKGTL
jgi:hypothetical protein